MNVKSRKILLPGQKIRALVVDDSVVIRRSSATLSKQIPASKWSASPPMAASRSSGFPN